MSSKTRTGGLNTKAESGGTKLKEVSIRRPRALTLKIDSIKREQNEKNSPSIRSPSYDKRLVWRF
jgi:hypothetical protein